MSSRPVSPLDHVASGTGPGLVLIHGTGADAASTWGALIDAASDRYAIVAPNLPGAGATPTPTRPLELDELAERVLSTARAADLERFHLVGHSIGAAIATTVAAREPDAVESLVLHAGWVSTGPREAFMFDLWTRLLHADRELLARHLILTAMSPGTLSGLDDEQAANLVAEFAAALDERILPQIELDRRIDVRASVGRVLAPTLVLASADDQIIPPAHQRELADAIRHSRYREVPGGHGLPFEDPARFASIVTEFVDAHETALSARAAR